MNQSSRVNVSESSAQTRRFQFISSVKDFFCQCEYFLFQCDGGSVPGCSCFSVKPVSVPGGEDGLRVLRIVRQGVPEEVKCTVVLAEAEVQ